MMKYERDLHAFTQTRHSIGFEINDEKKSRVRTQNKIHRQNDRLIIFHDFTLFFLWQSVLGT